MNEVLGWRFAVCFIDTLGASFKESAKYEYIKAYLGSALRSASSVLQVWRGKRRIAVASWDTRCGSRLHGSGEKAKPRQKQPLTEARAR